MKKVKKYLSVKLSKKDIKNTKFVKVMFGNQSFASGTGYPYKVDQINVTNDWNPKEKDSKLLGGFNISTEDKVLRWLVRGDTLYDVIIPENTDVYDCWSPSAPHGVFRTNKIIITNPKIITDEMAMELYHKSDLPEKSYFKAMAGCAIRGHINTAKEILKDKVNSENIELVIQEVEEFYKPTKGDKSTGSYECLEEICNMLLEIKNKIV